jgi:hypothetical protein
MTEQRLRELLRRHEVEDAGARARSLDVVRAAFREHEPARPRRTWVPVMAVATCAALAVVVTVTAGAPGDAVARWVRTVLGVGHQDARPALVRVPGGGKLLAGSWVVSADGSRRRLGSYDGTSWSPHGRFVVAWRGGELSALEPGGAVRWSLARSGPVRVARWAPVDGYRIAYLSGGDLRVVNGDGTGDHRHGPARERVAPAWRPDASRLLAYVDARDRVTVVNVDSRRVLWRSARETGIRELAWSAGGRRLLVAKARALQVRDRVGRVVARRALPPGLVADDVAWAPRGDRFAMVRRDVGARRSEVVLARARGRARVMFTGPGRFGTLAWSPTGRRLLVPWRQADQWLFLAPGAGGRTTAVGNIARQFEARAGRPAFAGDVEWCCPG